MNTQTKNFKKTILIGLVVSLMLQLSLGCRKDPDKDVTTKFGLVVEQTKGRNTTTSLIDYLKGMPTQNIESAAFQLEAGKALAFNQGNQTAAQKMFRKIALNLEHPCEKRAEAALLLMESLEAEGQTEKAIQVYEEIAGQVNEELSELETESFNWMEFSHCFNHVREKFTELVLGDFEPQEVPSLPKAFHKVITRIAEELPCKGGLSNLNIGRGSDKFMMPIWEANNRICDEKKAQQKLNRGQIEEEEVGYALNFSWPMIPAFSDSINNVIAYFSHDASAAPIPERYARFLPLDYQTMLSYVEANKGVVVVKLDGGATQFLVAAPNTPNIVQTIEAFQKLDHWPKDGLFVFDLAD